MQRFVRRNMQRRDGRWGHTRAGSGLRCARRSAAHYPNFSIGLDEDALPFDATIVGHEVVLLTLRQAHMVNAQGWTIFGMEMSGLSVVKTFSQAFDRTWGKRNLTKDPAAIRAWFMSQL